MTQWNEPYVTVETVKVVAIGKSVTFANRYYPGSGDLLVFVNGMYAVKDFDFTETTPFSIEFNDDLQPGDVVVAHRQKFW